MPFMTMVLSVSDKSVSDDDDDGVEMMNWLSKRSHMCSLAASPSEWLLRWQS